MNIAIIGAGNMGAGLAKNFARAGYGVALGDTDLAKARQVADELGSNVQAAEPRWAAAQAGIVVLAVPFAAMSEVVAGLGDLSGKVVVDISNPLTPDFSGLTIGHTTSAGEEVQKLIPGARVVKGFNTVLAQVLQEGSAFGDVKAQVLLASDDADAKATVSAITAKAGFEPVDAGPLKNARYLEALAFQNIQFAYALGMGAQIVPVWLKRAA